MTVPQKVSLARHPIDIDDDGHHHAEDVIYDPTASGLTAIDVQGAIDEIAAGISPGTVDAADVDVADAGGYFTGTDVEAVLQEFASKELGYQSHGILGSTETFSALTGWHSGTLDANCTFTFSGATSGKVASFILELETDGTSVVTWPGSVVWPGGVAPTLSTTPGDTDILTFFSHDGGSTWFGFMAGAGGGTSGRWELAVIPGSPPDPLYADGDFLYILVP